MYRFLLTPRWWAINVFVLLAIPFCVYMGSWQLSRFEDRVADHRQASAKADSGEDGTARPLEDALPVTKETVGEKVTARGRYADQLLVPDRKVDGETGYYVLTMLRVDGGRALPVVRGWLPGAADPDRAPAPPSGTVTVEGLLQASEQPGENGVSSRGGLPAGQTAAISAASLVNLVPYDLYDAWVTLTAGDAGMRPVPASAAPDSGLNLKAFQNLGYTGEWFVFAGFVVFMWFRLLRREIEFARDAELGLVPGQAEGNGSGAGAADRVEGTGSTAGVGPAEVASTSGGSPAGGPSDGSASAGQDPSGKDPSGKASPEGASSASEGASSAASPSPRGSSRGASPPGPAAGGSSSRDSSSAADEEQSATPASGFSEDASAPGERTAVKK